MNPIQRLMEEYAELLKQLPLDTEKLAEISRKIELYERIEGKLQRDC